MSARGDFAIRTIHRELPSEFDQLERVVEEAQAFMDETTDDEDMAYRVVLLVSEAVTNAMQHGNGFDPSKKVIFDLEAFPDRFELRVEDEGAGFEPTRIANPLSEEHLLDDSGRGLFLMKSYADEVHLENEGRCLRLVLRRP